PDAKGSVGLKLPRLRILEALSGFTRATGDAVGGGLARVFGRNPQAGSTKPVINQGPPALVPAGRRVYAIGDIHGRADLLVKLLRELHEDILKGEFSGRPILVFLGDYVDRGFQSRDVIDVLLGDMLSPFETYFLKGNHEAAMLQFL